MDADHAATIARLTEERDRMRPVVEAAVEWALADYVDTLPGGKADQRLRGAVGAWERQG